MNRSNALGPDPVKLYSYIELPIGATATGIPQERRKTGLWRYMRPKFEEKTPSCQENCPLGNCIQEFLAKTASGNLEEAWAALLLENPFPGVCGRVCYHPCETACSREELDGRLSIQGVERYLADFFLSHEPKFPVFREKQGRKIAIVGSGPAGLACAYFLKLMGYEVTVFEAQRELGGIPRLGIPAYRLPRSLLDGEIDRILSLGVEIRTKCKVGREEAFSDLLAEYDSIFLATGAHRLKPLNIPGDNEKGVYGGLEMLAKFNSGQPIDLGERILLIGGGNVAIDVSRTLLRLGRSPMMIYRRTREAMPAFHEEVEEALAEGAQFQYLLSPIAIRKHSKSGLLLECAKMKTGVSGADGRLQVLPIEGEALTFEADQIILATGELPEFSYLPGEIETTKEYIKVNECGQTSLDKVFAGGDIIHPPWTVSSAIGSAKRAAIAMDCFLRGKNLQEMIQSGTLARTMRKHLGMDGCSPKVQPKLAVLVDLNLAYAPSMPKHESQRLPFAERKGNFSEVNLGINKETAVYEAGRCLSCGSCTMCGNCYLFCPDGAIQLDAETGHYAIDYDYCKGCGICVNECPVGAISIEHE